MFVASIRFLRISSSDSILFLSNEQSSFLMLLFLNPTNIVYKKQFCTRASLHPQLSSLDINKIFWWSDMSLTTNSCADLDGNCLLLPSLVNKDVALDSLKWDLSILLSVFKFKLFFPFKYVWSTKSGAILLITASQILCSLYPFFNPLLIWNIKLEQISLSFYTGVPILPFILYSLNLIKVCNFSSFFNFSWKCSKLPVYKITNRGLVGIGWQWSPLSTNNLPIDYQCTIMFF